MTGPPLYTYLDQLLRDRWVSWSETYLNTPHDEQYTSNKGWQDRVEVIEGSVNADHRTRAGELYDSGMMIGRLVNQRGASRSSIPLGWARIQNDLHIHTSLGYFAYAIGKGLHANESEHKIQQGLSVIAAIILIRHRVSYQSQSVLLVAVFDHMLRNIPKPDGIERADWLRWMAAAMFCTLDSSNSDAFLSKVRNGHQLDEVTFILSDIEQVCKTNELEDFSNSHSFNVVNAPKNSLFWAAVPRGIYNIGISASSTLINKACQIDLAAFQAGNPSPFEEFARIPDAEPDSFCLIKSAQAAFSTEPQIWKNHMQTLKAGVIESLRYLDGNVQQDHIPRVYYAHGVALSDSLTLPAKIAVDIASCHGKPTDVDFISIQERKYKIVNVFSNDLTKKLELEIASLE